MKTGRCAAVSLVVVTGVVLLRRCRCGKAGSGVMSGRARLGSPVVCGTAGLAVRLPILRGWKVAPRTVRMGRAQLLTVTSQLLQTTPQPPPWRASPHTGPTSPSWRSSTMELVSSCWQAGPPSPPNTYPACNNLLQTKCFDFK